MSLVVCNFQGGGIAMIALKEIELYEISPIRMPMEFIPKSSHSQENISNNCESARVVEEPLSIVVDNTVYDKKEPRVLEQRLHAIRKELEQQLREHNRLLEMTRIQSARLAAIEPLPGLFLARLEELLYLIDQKAREGIVHDPITTTDELDKRFNRGIAQLRLLLNRDHVLENKELLEELSQTKTVLQAKRDEALQLRVEQEKLNQRLASTADKLERFDAEIALREERIAKLQKYVKESEVRHHKLFVDRRSIRNRRGPVAFNFASNKRNTSLRTQPWQIVPAFIGLTVGCMFTLFGVWIMF